jgi:isoquinoline 1-oxidoreductase alpha subunit
MAYTIKVNGAQHTVEAEPDMPLLWVLREKLGLTGTKFGCGAALCGACTVHVDGEPTRSCQLAIADAQGHAITTIEGLAPADAPHKIQVEWIARQVPQCGYCQSGMIMAVAALLAKTPSPSDADIETSITNICRCGTYPRVRAAIHALAQA